MPHYHIAQLTDFHLQQDPKAKLRSICTLESFKQTLQHAKRQQPDLYIFTGDLSHDGSKQSYQHIVTETTTIDCPIAWIPGNHDQPDNMQAVFESSHFCQDKVIQMGPWQLILLNSHWPGHIEGRLTEQQLQQLKQQLHSQQPTVIFLHHNIAEPTPIDTGAMFANTEQLLETILPYKPYIKAVVCGHVHAAYDFNYHGIRLLSTPSTCYQFCIDKGQVKQTRQPAGYRTFCLHDDGQFETTVCEISQSHQ